MNETEVQDVFCRFATSLSYSADNADRAEFLAHYLWLGMIGGPLIESGVWKSLEQLPGMAADDVKTVRTCYLNEMKPVVTADELKALRARYRIDPKRPAAGVEAAKERMFRETRLPIRQSGRRTRTRLLVLCGLCGGLYGASTGSLFAAVEASRRGALLGGVPFLIVGIAAGAAYGKFFGAVNRISWGRLFAGSVGGVLAGLAGVFFGAALSVYPTAGPGILFGAITGRYILFRQSPFGTALGVFLGTGFGMLVGASLQDSERAIAGVLWGLPAGLAGGVLAPLTLMGSLNTLRSTATKAT